MKNYIVTVLIVFLLIGCSFVTEEDRSIPAKKFLLNNPSVTLRIDNGNEIDKYFNWENQKKLINKVLTIKKGDNKKKEILLSEKWQHVGKIGEIISYDYEVKVYKRCKCVRDVLKIRLFLPKPKIIKQLKKEEFKMDLSIGTWIMLIIAMIVVAKLAHKISLKTIFKPTKKGVKHIQSEWKQS